MKKLISILLFAILLLSALSAAAEGEKTEDFLYTWKNEDMTLTFEEGSTVHAVIGGTEADSVWTERNGVFYLLGAKMDIEGGTLTVAFASGDQVLTREGYTPDAEPEPAAEEIDLTPYLGTWYYGAAYVIEISEDGTAVANGDTGSASTLYAENGVVMMDGMPCVLNEDGSLTVGDESYSLLLTREKPAAQMPDDLDAWLGDWYYTLDFGGEGSITEKLTLTDDGVAMLESDGDTLPLSWFCVDGQVYIEDTLIVMNEDGSITMQDDAWPMTFTREAAASAGPEPETEPVTEPAAAGARDFVGKTFAGVSCTASGVAVDISLLGRYSVSFYEDGSADMEIGGILMPVKCTWSEGDGCLIVNYVGQEYVFTWTESGLEMNYYDTMLIEYEAE